MQDSPDKSFLPQTVKEMIDTIPAAIFVKDSHSRIILMNHACENQWGVALEALRGTDASQFFPAEQMESFLAKDREIFASGKSIDFEEPFWSARLQETRTGHTFKKPIFDTNGTPLYLVGITIDVTDRKEAEKSRNVNDEKLRGLYELSPLGIALTDMNGKYLEFNDAFLQICGYEESELKKLDYWTLTPPKYQAAEARQLALLEESGRYGPYEKEYVRKNGSLVRIRLNGMLLHGSDGQKHIWSIVEDISDQKRREADLSIAACAFDAQVGILVTDTQGKILKVNEAFSRTSGYSQEEVVGCNPSVFKSGRHDAEFYSAMWASLRNTGLWQGEIWDRRKDGDIYPKWMTISAVKNEDGIIIHYVGTQSDISERKAAEKEIENLAFYDPLTRLPNRRLLFDRLQQALSNSRRIEGHGALLFIDLDNFKTLNDTSGHAKGDLLLQVTAERLVTCLREGDTVARLGGDEFVVMLENLSAEKNEAAAQAEMIGEKILSSLQDAYQLESHEHHATASIGVTLFDAKSISIEELLKQADLAMYQAKAAGRGVLRFFDPQMQAAIASRVNMEKELRKAVREKQFVLHYQAQVDGDGLVTGAEALVRWQHPERGLVFPDEFILLAEETNLILPLGTWVLETACRQLVIWGNTQNSANLTLAVNVSVQQLRQRDFVAQVESILERTGVDPRRLKLELTESHLMTEIEDTISKMNALQAKGIKFALDDFGTGYSSLSYLKRLPLEKLKIDRSFVMDVLTDPNDAAIAKTIIALAQSLGLAVIAEGVETEGQRDFLAAVGCHAYQGYLFSRPLSLERFEEFLGKGDQTVVIK